MQPEEIKRRLLALTVPLDEFMRTHGIASFSLPNADDDTNTLDISAFRHPLPPRIKMSLGRFGCIYMVDEAGTCDDVAVTANYAGAGEA